MKYLLENGGYGGHPADFCPFLSGARQLQKFTKLKLNDQRPTADNVRSVDIQIITIRSVNDLSHPAVAR